MNIHIYHVDTSGYDTCRVIEAIRVIRTIRAIRVIRATRSSRKVRLMKNAPDALNNSENDNKLSPAAINGIGRPIQVIRVFTIIRVL